MPRFSNSDPVLDGVKFSNGPKSPILVRKCCVYADTLTIHLQHGIWCDGCRVVQKKCNVISSANISRSVHLIFPKLRRSVGAAILYTFKSFILLEFIL